MHVRRSPARRTVSSVAPETAGVPRHRQGRGHGSPGGLRGMAEGRTDLAICVAAVPGEGPVPLELPLSSYHPG